MDAKVTRIQFDHQATAHDLTIVEYPDVVVVSDHRVNPAWSAALPRECWTQSEYRYLSEKLGCPEVDALAIATAVEVALNPRDALVSQITELLARHGMRK